MLASNGMERRKCSKLGEVEEEEEVVVEEGEDGAAEEEESGSEFEVDDDEEEGSDGPNFRVSRKRKRGGGGGGGGKKATRGNKKPATAAAGAATPSFTSSYRGVRLRPGSRRWQAEFRHNGPQTCLGSFDTEEGAARAYDRMAVSCELHRLVKNQPGTKGGGSFLKNLNFEYADYKAELEELGRMTKEELVLTLRRGEGTRAPTSSTFRGVSWRPGGGRWEATFQHNNKQTSLGQFATEEGAARANDNMAVWCKLRGWKWRGGFKLNFDSAEYRCELEELGRMTQAEVVAKLRLQAKAQREAASNAEGAGGNVGAAELSGAMDDESGSGGEGGGVGDGAPAPQSSAPPLVGAGASGVTVKEEEEEETLGQLRDRLGLGPGAARVPVAGPRATFVHIKVEDTTSGEDTDGEGEAGGTGGPAAADAADATGADAKA
jgi:hypothetical protein